MRFVGFLAITLMIVLSGCVGPPVLEQQVLGYDEVTSRLDQKLVLLNIARVDNERPVHFTITSSIAATFDWTTTIGIGGQVEESSGTNFFNFNLGGSASENPTFQIIPLSGEEFTKRILTPFKESVFEFMVYEGSVIDRVMRLVANGIEVQNPDSSFVRFIDNDPRRPNEYEEFRRIALHLRWLSENRHLFVRTLVFEEVLIDDYKRVPDADDINDGFEKGLRWQQKPNGNYKLTRLSAGRVVVTNFDPMALTDRERFELNERIKNNPKSFVYVHIRPDGPGGDFPLQGAIKLRSVQQIIVFVARGIRAAREFDVQPDPRTGEIAENPPTTLDINLSDSAPDGNFLSIIFGGKHYSVADTLWDRASFATLDDLFQTAVGDVEQVGIPITISK